MSTFQKILENIHNDFVYIKTHNFPDPDAIASAFGMQHLLKAHGIASQIVYSGKIDRVSTSMMVEKLGIDLKKLEEIPEIGMEQDVILVDSQKGNSNLTEFEGEDVICIDHHPRYENIQYRFCDIRPEIGACVSIVAEYFDEEGIVMDKNVATAIMYGLKIDTANMTRGVAKLDLDVFYDLYYLADRDMINTWELSTLQLSDMDAYVHALSAIEVHEDISFTNTGEVCPEALVANISDFMLSLAEVRISVVTSATFEGIKVSVRSERKSYDSGKLAHKALETIGNGGGHYCMAGGFVPCSIEQQKEMIEKIKKSFLEAVREQRI